MKRSGKMFFRIFLRSFVLVIILLLTGVLSYKAAMLYWAPDKNDSKTAYQADTVQSSVPGGVEIEDKDGISKNLILCYDNVNHEITRLMLEVLNSESNKLTYITLPAKTQYTMSGALYQKLILDEPEIPQVLMLSTITKYLTGDKAYENELLIVEELLGTKINYYTVITQDTFETMFKDKNVQPSKKYDPIPMEIFTGEYKKKLRSLDTDDKRKAYLENLYPELTTNLSLEDKLGFLDSYNNMSLDDVSFQLVPGENRNSAYLIDSKRTEQLISELTGIN